MSKVKTKEIIKLIFFCIEVAIAKCVIEPSLMIHSTWTMMKDPPKLE